MLKVLHITDPHLKPRSGDTMFGIDTEEFFQRALAHANQHNGPFDLILLTGDLAQDPSADTYQRILKHLLNYDTRCLCLPGNHDDFDMMKHYLNRLPVSCDKLLALDDWQVIGLNSQIPNSPVGELSSEELAFLERSLAATRNRHTLIAVHHHCIPSGSDWLDTMQIQNSDAFLSLVKAFPQVKAVIFGHVHQALSITVNQLAILGTPASSFQFMPNSTEFSISDLPPGYRVLELSADGHVESVCHYLPIKMDSLDRNAHGY